jgi:phosphoglycolate phosphatase
MSTSQTCPFAAVIFDLDGTLLDTLDDLAAAVNEALHRHGCARLGRETIQSFIGCGARQLVTSAVRATRPTWPDEKIEPVYRTYRQIYGQNWNIRTQPYPGITELLGQLKSAGIKLAVLSNKPQVDTEAVVRYYFGEDTFDLCYGQLDPFPVKPDPALALHIAYQLDIPAERIALVGDSGSDMQTAVRAHMTGIGALWGFRDAEDLKAGGAAFLVEDAAGLKKLLLS